jgi:hypothetical protein
LKVAAFEQERVNHGSALVCGIDTV